jgi:hypothetical protein
MFFRTLLCSLVVLVSISSVSHAAVLRSAGPDVKVDTRTGWGAQLVPPTTNVQPGHLVKVGANSTATIVFSNGCSITLRSHQKMIVPRKPPICSGGPVAANDNGLLVIGGVVVVGGTIAVVSSHSSSKSASP